MSATFPRWLVLLGAALLTAGAVVTVSCGNPSGEGNGCQGTGSNIIISAQDNLTFDKPMLTITHGDQVCWQNLGHVDHTVTHTSSAPFDSTWTIDAQLNPGSLVIHSFGVVGNYLYHCSIHSGMTGEIDVR